MNKTTIAIIIIIIVLVGGGIIVKKMNSSPADVPASPDINDMTGGDTTDALEGETSTSTATSTPTSSGSSSVKEFAISAKNFSFVPSTMTVKKGDTVKITFKNDSGIHDFKIDEFAVATKQLKTGESETVEFVADKTGAFEYYCSVGTHRQMGMKGTLTVQ